MKLIKSKQGLAFTATTIFAFGALILLLFTSGGIIKFLVSDKTPLILGGLFIFLLLYSKKKHER